MPSTSTTYGIPSDYSDQLRQMRGRLGLPQTHLAQLLGVTPATVASWESGKAQPSLHMWRQILRMDDAGLDTTGQSYTEDTAIRESESPHTFLGSDTPDIDFAADPEVVRVVAEGERLSLRPPLQPGLRHRDLADRPAAPPAHRRLRAHAAPAPPALPAGRRCRRRQDDHGRPLHPRDARPPAAAARPDRPARRAGGQLGARAADAVRPRLSTSSPAATPATAIRSSGRTATWSSSASTRWRGERVFARLQEPGRRALRPGDLRRGPQAVGRPRARLHASARPTATGWPRRWPGVRTRRPALAAALERPAPAAAHRHPHMGKDYPYYALWRLLEPEVLSHRDAFNAYPPTPAQRHFIRRTKEEMVTLRRHAASTRSGSRTRSATT